MLRQGFDAIVDKLRKAIRAAGDTVNLDPYLDDVERLPADTQARVILRAALLKVAEEECKAWRKKQHGRMARYD